MKLLAIRYDGARPVEFWTVHDGPTTEVEVVTRRAGSLRPLSVRHMTYQDAEAYAASLQKTPRRRARASA